MRTIRFGDFQQWRTLATFLPLSLWALLWLSLSPGSLNAILHPGSFGDFAGGIRASFPFAAAIVASMFIAYRLIRRQPPGFRFIGPLGLATVYGLVGLLAAWKSPHTTLAAIWAILYLSVPVVLWGIVWGTQSLDRLRLLLSTTWIVIVLGTIVLFVIGVLYLDFEDELIHPRRLLQCGSGGWFDLTDGRLRDTAVGRYAAIAGLVAISGLWRPNWRLVWGSILAACILLLLFSGARGAMGGFAVGTVLTVALYGGRRAVLAGALALALFALVFWATGLFDTFYHDCLFRGSRSQTSEQQVSPPAIETLQVTQGASEERQPDNDQQSTQEAPTPVDTGALPSDSPSSTPEQQSDKTQQSTAKALIPVDTGALPADPPSSTPEQQSDKTQQSTQEAPITVDTGTLPADPPSSSPEQQSDKTQQSTAKAPITVDTGTLPADPPSSTQEQPPDKTQQSPSTTPLPVVVDALPSDSPSSTPEQQSDKTQQSTAKAPIPVDTGTLPADPPSSTQEQPPDKTKETPQPPEPPVNPGKTVELGFFEFTGRSAVWAEALDRFKDSPVIGFGFHADRLLLGTHAHNAFVHAVIQTGVVGTIPFLSAIILGWVLLFRNARKLKLFPETHKHLLIQCGAVLGFLTARGFPESSGAFFGVDWLILAPVLLYLHLVHSSYDTTQTVPGGQPGWSLRPRLLSRFLT
ncbi:hypothetical protein FIM07_00630 [SAR202 cluster bacterium AD-802-F09_MRT_200m]|nr:hypothetical protein [SAR202 cluster bacterium AD-802-F09_MRT_200m]